MTTGRINQVCVQRLVPQFGAFSGFADLISYLEFACLLPPLDVVAVSQAPSPELNPNSPLPVIATVSQYLTVSS